MQLNPTHYLAIEMLMTGATNKAIAEKLSVAPETVSKWRGDYDFQAELNTQLKANQEAAQERLRHLTGKALDTIEKVMSDEQAPHKDRLAASLKVLEITQTKPEKIGATDVENLKQAFEQEKFFESMVL